jgi:hypothetical protein
MKHLQWEMTEALNEPVGCLTVDTLLMAPTEPQCELSAAWLSSDKDRTGGDVEH